MQRETTGGMVHVTEYNPEWRDHFRQLRDRIWPTVSDLALTIEHVGSTAVAGLSAKPIIDLDIVIESRNGLPLVVARLAELGYEPLGNLGIEDRNAFRMLVNQPPHNLYVCPQDSVALRNHLALRDHLRNRSEDAVSYSKLKKQLAARYPHDIAKYVEGKTDFILSILRQYGFSADQMDSIRQSNQS